MIFFESEQVIKLHSSLIAKTGGMDGVRNENLLDSALKSPFQTFDGNELYSDIYDKASKLCYSLVENHPFADGNKRIGVHLILLFLKLNNENIEYSQAELIDFGLNIASGKMNKADIKAWLLNHRKKI
ncbi:MAG: type II toxin-antitoxin system death-on-curing family toxin [Treponema sp.]|nr:type II toxin-antitoxin system death-on-curing family toxin [Treponema sp.]MBQ6056637.1 type II toxin-antitoxin system death-on-curing family toxin [Treponema sp.]MBR0487914.1 type II toxin-antitoxin system death-on-curing family toxin [Treponema sp.]